MFGDRYMHSPLHEDVLFKSKQAQKNKPKRNKNNMCMEMKVFNNPRDALPQHEDIFLRKKTRNLKRS